MRSALVNKVHCAVCAVFVGVLYTCGNEENPLSIQYQSANCVRILDSEIDMLTDLLSDRVELACLLPC